MRNEALDGALDLFLEKVREGRVGLETIISAVLDDLTLRTAPAAQPAIVGEDDPLGVEDNLTRRLAEALLRRLIFEERLWDREGAPGNAERIGALYGKWRDKYPVLALSLWRKLCASAILPQHWKFLGQMQSPPVEATQLLLCRFDDPGFSFVGFSTTKNNSKNAVAIFMHFLDPIIRVKVIERWLAAPPNPDGHWQEWIDLLNVLSNGDLNDAVKEAFRAQLLEKFKQLKPHAETIKKAYAYTSTDDRTKSTLCAMLLDNDAITDDDLVWALYDAPHPDTFDRALKLAVQRNLKIAWWTGVFSSYIEDASVPTFNSVRQARLGSFLHDRAVRTGTWREQITAAKALMAQGEEYAEAVPDLLAQLRSPSAADVIAIIDTRKDMFDDDSPVDQALISACVAVNGVRMIREWVKLFSLVTPGSSFAGQIIMLLQGRELDSAYLASIFDQLPDESPFRQQVHQMACNAPYVPNSGRAGSDEWFDWLRALLPIEPATA